MPYTFAPDGKDAWPLHVVQSDEVDLWVAQQSDSVRSWVEVNHFSAALGSALMLPLAEGGVAGAVVGLVFAFLKLPLPAPPVLPGIIGIFGVYLGGMVYQQFIVPMIS